MIKKKLKSTEHKIVKYIMDDNTPTIATNKISTYNTINTSSVIATQLLADSNFRLQIKEAALEQGVTPACLIEKAVQLLDAKKLHGVNNVSIEDNSTQLRTLQLLGEWLGVTDKEQLLSDPNLLIGKSKLSQLSSEQIDTLIKLGESEIAEHEVV